jgi:glycine hydroxymethyltransferase
MIPFDERKPTQTSGLRLGTPALTTRGLDAPQMSTVADLLHDALSAAGAEPALLRVRERVRDLCAQFPVSHA